MKRFFKGRIKGGEFKGDTENFRRNAKTLPDGNYIYFLIKVTDKDRRECQNFYFAILGSWSLDTGFTRKELHSLVKEELFVSLFGEEISTTDLTPQQWTIVFLELENWLILKFENK